MQSKVCKYCGSKNPIGANKCVICNMELEDYKGQVNPQTANLYDDTIELTDSQKESAGFCPNCGKMIYSHMERCGSCGYDLGTLNLSERIAAIHDQKAHSSVDASPQKETPVHKQQSSGTLNLSSPTIRIAVVAFAMFLIGGTSVGLIMHMAQQKKQQPNNQRLEVIPTTTTTANAENITAIQESQWEIEIVTEPPIIAVPETVSQVQNTDAPVVPETTYVFTTAKPITTTRPIAITTTQPMVTTTIRTIVTEPPATKENSRSKRGTPNSGDGFANLRGSMNYSNNIICAVKNGTIMTVTSTSDPEWYYVTPDHSGVGGGFMKADLVELFDDLSNVMTPKNMNYIGRGTSTSADGFLNVHSDPSISNGNSVDTLPNGAYADIYNYGNKTWYYAVTATGYGFVKADFVRFLRAGAQEEIIYNSEFGYMQNPNAKKSSSTQGGSQTVKVTPCEIYGEINTRGKKIASFETSYVVEYGKKSVLREELGNRWHIYAVNECYSYNVHWYELYDADDGDYYGWVDADYITFYE